MIEFQLNETYRVNYHAGFGMISILRNDKALLTHTDWFDEYASVYPVALKYLESEGFLQ